MATISNIVIDQGTTFSLELNLTNDDNSAKNLADYTVTSQMRKSYEATTATDFTTAKVDATGKITISLTAAQTAALKSGRYVYDIEIASSAETLRVLEGIVTVTPNVTRAYEITRQRQYTLLAHQLKFLLLLVVQESFHRQQLNQQ